MKNMTAMMKENEDSEDDVDESKKDDICTGKKHKRPQK